MTTVVDLPDEILLKIFSFLDVLDVAMSVSDVCYRWNRLANDSILWNNLQLTVDKSREICELLKCLPYLGQLKCVKLQWRTDVKDLINVLSLYCPNLTGVEMICCGFYNRDDIRTLMQCYPNIRVFSLAKSWSIPPQCLDDVALLKNLTSLNLSNSLLTPTQFNVISENCANISSINVDYVRGLSEFDLARFISPRTSILVALTVYGELLSNSFLQHIEGCYRLKLLHISTCRNFTDHCFESINDMNLKSLTLRKSVQFSAKALREFYSNSKTVKSLSHLYISAKRIVRREDVSEWPSLDESHADQFCLCILSKEGFKTYNTSQ